MVRISRLRKTESADVTTYVFKTFTSKPITTQISKENSNPLFNKLHIAENSEKHVLVSKSILSPVMSK